MAKFTLKSGNKPSFKEMGSSPLNACAPGEPGCGIKNRKFDKPGTVVSRTAQKVGSWVKGVFKRKPKYKKRYTTTSDSKRGSHRTVRYM